ncbi:hypothetical protein STEG23_030821 [Scotinomys teguina]
MKVRLHMQMCGFPREIEMGNLWALYSHSNLSITVKLYMIGWLLYLPHQQSDSGIESGVYLGFKWLLCKCQ